MLPHNLIRSSTSTVTSLCTFLCLTHYAHAATDPAQIEQQQYNQYQQRIENLKDKTTEPFVNLNGSAVYDNLQQLPLDETPCFSINHIALKLPNQAAQKQKFATVLDPIRYGSKSIIGKCIGQQGLSYTVRNVQNELIKQGFITTQATISAQDLTTGQLAITVIPGRINQIWRSQDGHPKTNISNALTLSQDDILNLRDIETSLENFRLPQSSATNIDIIPSVNDITDEQYGSSDLVVAQYQTNPLHWQLSIDDSGNKDTGKYQGTVSASIDRPLNSNDVLDLSYTHTVDPWNSVRDKADNHSLYVNYRYPYKEWQLQLMYSDYNFNQTLAGLNQDIKYRGESNQGSIGLQKIVHRDDKSKTIINLDGYHKNSKNYFDDQEIEVQRRRTSGWKLGISHERQTVIGDMSTHLEYQKGTGALSAIKAPESYISETASQPSIWSAQVSLRHPFSIVDSAYQYNMQWRGQYSSQSLIPQDRFSIGGRYTIKGLNDEQSLSGEHGVLLQQEVARVLPATEKVTIMPYLALDQGWVGGESTQYLSGNYLMSTSIGARIYANNISIDSFIGKGLQAPQSIDKSTTGGFKITIYN